MQLESLFATPANLPTVPKVMQQLIRSFSKEDVALAEITDMITADPVLSAKTLRLANSAYFHVSRRIADIDDALRMLGFVMVRNLVMSCSVSGAFHRVPGMDMALFWRHSLHTACAGRWLALETERNADLAFTIGLIHGLGQLLLHRLLPHEMEELDAQSHPLAADRAVVEAARLGFHHADVSAELARRWKFPEEITLPIQAVPDPLMSDAPSEMAAVVHVAAWRARVDALQLDDAQAAASCPTGAGRAMGLSLAWLPESHTLGSTPFSHLPPMPPLKELSEGLEAMFE